MTANGLSLAYVLDLLVGPGMVSHPVRLFGLLAGAGETPTYGDSEMNQPASYWQVPVLTGSVVSIGWYWADRNTSPGRCYSRGRRSQPVRFSMKPAA